MIRSASGCEENRDPENEGLSSLGHPGVKHGAQDLLAETRRPELQACLSQQDL